MYSELVMCFRMAKVTNNIVDNVIDTCYDSSRKMDCRELMHSLTHYMPDVTDVCQRTSSSTTGRTRINIITQFTLHSIKLK